MTASRIEEIKKRVAGAIDETIHCIEYPIRTIDCGDLAVTNSLNRMISLGHHARHDIPWLLECISELNQEVERAYRSACRWPCKNLVKEVNYTCMPCRELEVFRSKFPKEEVL